MPCNGDYLEPTDFEINLSKVYQLLDELNGKKLPKDFGDGFDKRVYNKSEDEDILNKKVSELCGKLSKISRKAISKLSLEMQMWWRDHQRADKKRIAFEKSEKARLKTKAKALSKLSKKEREALMV